MAAMAGEAEGEVVVPPNLQALLAARLDQLETGERGVLERGAVEGETFHRGAVQALASGDPQVTPRLTALVRKELIRSDTPQFAGEDGFRFRHLLIRDAAYNALPKAVRAELHKRFAAWLEEHGADLVELDEILGYHLEQAVLYLAELGAPDDAPLAAGARRRLTAAGRRADRRQDYRAALNLYERATALVPPTEIDIALETDFARGLFEIGRGEDALRHARSLAERSAAAGARVAELCGRIQEATLLTFLDPEGATEKLAALTAEALPVFEAAGDEVALYLGYSGLGQVAAMRGKMDAALAAFERGSTHARQAGLLHEFVGWRATARLFGSTPLSEFIAWLDEVEPQVGWRHSLVRDRAEALAMLGRFDEARALLADIEKGLADRGGGVALATTTAMASVDIELLAGDPAAAAELGEAGCKLLDELGEQNFLSTAAGTLAQALYALDRLEEADTWAGRGAELGASDDAITQMLWRQVRAKVLARRGELAEAERLARAAIAIGEETDMINAQGEAYADLAEVLAIAGSSEAAGALQQALDRFERKGNLVSTRRAQARLAELQDAVPR
jgi:tetratricopeptide (TPR) repeat protein